MVLQYSTVLDNCLTIYKLEVCRIVLTLVWGEQAEKMFLDVCCFFFYITKMILPLTCDRIQLVTEQSGCKEKTWIFPPLFHVLWENKRGIRELERLKPTRFSPQTHLLQKQTPSDERPSLSPSAASENKGLYMIVIHRSCCIVSTQSVWL